MEIQEQKELLQRLIKEYQHKLRDIQYMKDDYERLKYLNNSIKQLNASYELSIENLEQNQDERMKYIKREIGLRMVNELIENNSIVFRIEKSNDFDYFCRQVRVHGLLTYIKN